MAVDVDWAGTDPTNPYRIYIPKADMVLIQSTPIEVRRLDANTLRSELKDLEASVDGMPWTDTHEHIGERLLSGIVYGRSVEVLPPYVLEFENGLYAVTIVGGNTNFGDRKVPNSVSLIGNNSAGLINTTDQLVNYQFAIWVDTINGNPGTIQGINGTPGNPVNNLDDAVTLANGLNIRTIQFTTGVDLLGVPLEDFNVILGKNATINFGGQSADNSEFIGGTLTGSMTGTIRAERSDLVDVSGFMGEALMCGFDGTTVLGTGSSDLFLCHSHVAGVSTPIIDFNGAGSKLSNRAWTGGIDIRNMTDPSNIASVDMLSGNVKIDSSCTDGQLVVRDGSLLTDNSAGTQVILGLAGQRVWNVLSAAYATAGTMGALLSQIALDAELARQMSVNRLEIDFGTSPVQLVLYADDGVAELRRWDLETNGGEDVTTNVGVQTKRTPE